jgi:hypothetical protein
MMRYLLILTTTLAIMACSPAAVRNDKSATMQLTALTQNEASEAGTMEFLVRSAAADFHAHTPTRNLYFQNVRLGYLASSKGQIKYMLCGEFLKNLDIQHSERGFFMTIDSPGGPNGYNQLLSGEVISTCHNPSVTWSGVGDLSSSLQSRFDSL